MASGEKIPMVLFSRYTTINGAGTYYTTPIDVLGFGTADINFWYAPLTGGGNPTISFDFEQSTNLVEWKAMATVSGLAADTVVAHEVTPLMRYIRCSVTLGADTDWVGATFWAVGYGVRTET